MEEKLLTPICIVLTLCFVLTGHTVAQNSDSYELDQQYEINLDGTVALHSDDAKVTIRGMDRDDVHLNVQYKAEVKGFTFGRRDKFEMIVEERNGDLVIKEKPRDFKGANFGYFKEDYEITLEVPRSVSLDIDGDDDSYRISGIDGSIAMDTDDSSIHVEDNRGSSFSFDFDDGDLFLEQGSGELVLDYDDGDVEIRKGDFSSVVMDADDGSLELATVLHDDGLYEFDMDDGKLTLTVLGGGGNFKVQHDEIRVRSGSNFNHIRNEENMDEFELPGGTAKVRVQTDDGKVIFETL